MADLGDIGTFLDEQPVSDLSWLEVDKDEYRHHMETLPKQNLDSVPELQEHFKSLSDRERFHLNPENREPARPTTPFFAERPHYGKLTDEDAVRLVEEFTRQQVQAGVAGRQVIANLKKKFDPRTLGASASRIRSVLDERGLLGSVYLDSRLFPKCASGGVSKMLTASNKAADYVLAKSACTGCVHNKEGRCAIFTKELAFNVNYDETLWENIKSRLHDRDLSGLDHLEPRERIQAALLRPLKETAKPLDSKPVAAHIADSITPEEAVRQLFAASGTQQVVGNVYLRRKQLRWAKAMMAGNHGKQVQDRVAHDPDLVALQRDLYVMGHLYADISYFPTYKAASEFLGSLENAPAVVVGMPYAESQFDGRFASMPTVDVRHPDMLRPLLHRALVATLGPNASSAASQARFDKMWESVRGASAEDALAFAQKVYAMPLSEAARVYAAQQVYDPNQGMSFEEARERFAQMESKREVVESNRVRDNRTELVLAMLGGDHGKRVASLIESDARLRDLKAHLHLLGKLYLDTTLLPSEKIASLPDAIKALPYLTESNRETFFTSPHAHGPIAERLAAHKGLEGNARRAYMRRTVQSLQKMEGARVRALARAAFAKPVRKAAAPTGYAMLNEYDMSLTSSMDVDINPEGDHSSLDMDFKTDFII